MARLCCGRVMERTVADALLLTDWTDYSPSILDGLDQGGEGTEGARAEGRRGVRERRETETSVAKGGVQQEQEGEKVGGGHDVDESSVTIWGKGGRGKGGRK